MKTEPFKSLLIANRGEIACRIIHTARRMGLETIAVYSEADADARHVRLADKATRIGPAAPSESYLKIDAVLEAARQSGAEAIHPGYGFLSENAAFAKAVVEAGLIWIGPPAAAIAAMGDKAAAKALMAKAGVPLIPGWRGEAQDAASLSQAAQAVGFPLLIKAVAGGGGRGMRVVETPEAFGEALAAAQREAKSAFGDDRVMLERYLAGARHVEIQILADAHGGAVHLFERDCSTQRRRQKVIEEAPSPALDGDLRAAMGEAAVKAAQAVNYVNAGTVEFLLSGREFFFLEMNTRLQVEHPVTEIITGRYLIQHQIEIAQGAPLPFTQADLDLNGWAIEARLYAENPDENFSPQTGPVLHFDLDRRIGPGRVDAGIETGDEISAHYDPMVAKFIAWGASRDEAREALIQSLKARPLLGVKTNRAFLIRLLESAAFKDAEIETGTLDAWQAAGQGPFAPAPLPFEIFALAAAARAAAPAGTLRSGSVTTFDLTLEADGARRTLRIEQHRDGSITASEGEASARARLLSREGAKVRAEIDGLVHTLALIEAGETLHIAWGGHDAAITEPSAFALAQAAAGDAVLAPMTGLVTALTAEPGQAVKAGEILGAMEAMKMETPLKAPRDGVVKAVNAKAGDQAAHRFVLIELEPLGEDQPHG